jgi:hypothetical protein
MSDDNEPVTFDEYGGKTDPEDSVPEEVVPPDDEENSEE